MWSQFIGLRSAALRCGIRKMTVGFVAAAICSGLLVQAASADGTGSPAKTNAAPGTVDWAGLNWGLGIAADFDVTGSRVVNANVVNGIVRATDTSSNVGVGFVLEAHYFLKAWPFVSDNDVFQKFLKTYGMRPPGECIFQDPLNKYKDTIIASCSEVAIGPFVAVEVGGGSGATPAANGPITGYALGVMVGLHQPSLDAKAQTRTWNFGIGLRIDPKAQVLGDGLIANAPLPVGDSIRFKTEPRLGVMLLSSFSF